MPAATDSPRRPARTHSSGQAPFEAEHSRAVLAHASILVVDDEPGMRNFLVRILERQAKRVDAVSCAEDATRQLDAHHYDLVVLDNVMPGQSGLDWLDEQRHIGFFSEAILMTAYADLETAIQALRLGAADFVLKPFRSNQILNALMRCLDRRVLRRENFLLRYELGAEAPTARGRLLGNSPSIEAVRATLAKVAPTAMPVLLTGESGTGKEIAARTLHSISGRAERPFVPINCAAISPDRIETELFGEIGAGGHEGLLVNASGGTLFLDEIVELPLTVQASLLRVIDENRLRPSGSEREIPLNLRFVAATNADLERAVADGTFRRDLFFRISGMTIRMPPLRERVGDIADLAAMFMDRSAREMGTPPLPLSEEVLVRLGRYDWPGNVRELRNLIERAVILGRLPPEFAAATDTHHAEPSESLEAMERRHILTVLEACGGNRAEAARRLGVARKTVDRKCALWNV